MTVRLYSRQITNLFYTLDIVSPVTATTFKVKIPENLYSVDYTVVVIKKEEGITLATAATTNHLKLAITVDSLNKAGGSPLGGTTLIIAGKNFGARN